MLVAPAMNDRMWEHAATQDNLARLRERGVHVVDPGSGALATKNEWGMGRLAEPPGLLAAVEAVMAAQPAGGWASGSWDRLRVLVTAGGTREPIDAVRYVGNRSSGRMGFAVAEEAAALGARVTVVAASVALPRDPRIRYVDVETAAELRDACTAQFGDTDVLVMTAAVADFRPSGVAEGKIKKSGRSGLELHLEPTADILAELAALRRADQTVVGFAAEHGAQALAHGRDKLARKGLDAIVVNDVSQPGIGFDAADNEVTIVTAGGEEHVTRSAKPEVARAILATVQRLRAAKTRERV
jgi:phosphopantothenoylcysteine decarboxylase/phosphopantothenate--cysteine ligase